MALESDGVNVGRTHAGDGATMEDFLHDDSTMMMWINMDGWGASADGIIMTKSTPTAYKPWCWRVYGSAGQYMFFEMHVVGRSLSARLRVRTDTSSLSLSVDHHVAVTWDGDQIDISNFKFYIDGESVTVTQIGSADTGALEPDGAYDLNLGNRSYGDRAWDGRQWDARVYGRILRADEILSIYTARGSDRNVHGLLGRWSMLNGHIVDLSGNGNGIVYGFYVPDFVADPNAGHW